MRTSNVLAAELPAQSILHRRVGANDFLDCYSVVSDLPLRQAAEVITAFPGWVHVLLRIRRFLTLPFGLINNGPADDKIGIFPIESETGRELIAGFDDRHLDYRISIFSQNGRLFFATWVHPHNIGGMLYLKMVLPFHVLIIRNALARLYAHEVKHQAQ